VEKWKGGKVEKWKGGKVVRWSGGRENIPNFGKNLTMRYFLTALVFIMILPALKGQVREESNETAASIPFFYGFYGYQWPGGEMKNQFGSNSVIGLGFEWKTASNWLFGAEYDFIFGNEVKNGMEIFQHLINSNGDIISGGGTPSLVATFERGNTVGIKFGKLFPVMKSNKNSGIFLTAGTGYMMHKIRIEVENEGAPQLAGDYKRGYDRLSGGFMLNQSVGFIFFGKSSLLNFTLSVEAFEGWNKAYRDYYFDQMAPPPEGRQFDFLIGPKIAWMIPIRARNEGTYYYY
jgi:hypothetical protein